MAKISLEDIEHYLDKQGDWTIKLLNKNLPLPERHMLGLLWFNGRANLWTARFVNKNFELVFKEGGKEFLETKRTLLKKVKHYLSQGYEITIIQSGYYIPSVFKQRKRGGVLTNLFLQLLLG